MIGAGPDDEANIVLTGFMASGKSTVGRALARRMEREFLDTDIMIESRSGMSVEDIFQRRGEEVFRKMEREAVREVSRLRRKVIAVGGGAVLDPGNVDDLAASGRLYFLDTEPEAVFERAGGKKGRPLMSEGIEGVRELMEARREAYAGAADARIDTSGKTPEQLAGEILSDFEGSGRR